MDAFKGTGFLSSIIYDGKSLNVQAVLEGSVRKSDDRLRISTQLIDVTDGCHLWSQQFDREVADIFEIQVEIARNISQSIRILLFLCQHLFFTG